jgi:hypothetical protein
MGNANGVPKSFTEQWVIIDDQESRHERPRANVQ